MIKLLFLVASLCGVGTILEHSMLAKLRASDALIQQRLQTIGQRQLETSTLKGQATTDWDEVSADVERLWAAQKEQLDWAFDIRRRGTWPADKDYFYLPKSALPSVGFSVFHSGLSGHYGSKLSWIKDSGIGGWEPINLRDDLTDVAGYSTLYLHGCKWTNVVTETAALLFGLSETERHQVSEAYQHAWRHYGTLIANRVECYDEPIDNNPGYEPFCYYIPQNAGEEEVPVDDFKAKVTSILGKERSELFLTQAASELRDELVHECRTPVVIWFDAQGQLGSKVGYLEIDNREGGIIYRDSYSLNSLQKLIFWELKPQASHKPWPFRNQ